ncbi:hypothetical protein BS47DRAFT_1343192 [Hydnum rufescens UP504]|uniref:Uncharacterized protein n=1 Tax=Hydnum rufescens UP504 TaxID=1448309 RepID=A0A9P6AYB8_9AGAM|nr:hypothetical protein BS47DRAFT_1343192 [Hydnum rufescens UP504]
MRHVRLPPAILFLVALLRVREPKSAACEEPQERIDCPRGCEEDGCKNDKPMLDPRAFPIPLKKSNEGY